jgi:hypothetical protein
MKEMMMTIHELVTLLNTLEPDKDVFVACFTTDGTGELFDIEAVHDNNGHAQLEIYEEEREADLEDTPMPAASVVASERVQAAVEVFHDLCERQGLTEEDKDLIWNAMAGVCDEHVRQRQGAFYEAIKPLFAEGEA